MSTSSGQRPLRPAARLIYRLITFIALLSVSALLLGSMGGWYWPFDLFAHFRVHSTFALLVCAIALLSLRDFRGGVIAILAAVLGALPLVDYLVPSREPLELESSGSLRVLSLNAWFRNDDPNRLVEYLETSGADVIVLQELSEDEARALHARLKVYPYAFVEGASASDAVLLSRWPISASDVVPLVSDGVGVIRATIDWQGKSFTLIGAHLHWPIGPRSAERRNSELAGLALLAQSQHEPLVILGDFNITPWSPHFETFLQVSGLRDCARGNGLDPTWPSQFILAGIRIDHCFMSSHWRALDAHTGPHVGSDHRPMIVELELR